METMLHSFIALDNYYLGQSLIEEQFFEGIQSSRELLLFTPFNIAFNVSSRIILVSDFVNHFKRFSFLGGQSGVPEVNQKHNAVWVVLSVEGGVFKAGVKNQSLVVLPGSSLTPHLNPTVVFWNINTEVGGEDEVAAVGVRGHARARPLAGEHHAPHRQRDRQRLQQGHGLGEAGAVLQVPAAEALQPHAGPAGAHGRHHGAVPAELAHRPQVLLELLLDHVALGLQGPAPRELRGLPPRPRLQAFDILLARLV
mmetsp:Transcript_35874/g.56297  ORF Transcript_35874/g.56297 Transcript_35874/m.56297 type:complete len:254 (+) Transcript_35874:556-1317(+)